VPQHRGGGRGWIVAAVTIVGLAVVGGVVAVVLSKQHQPAQAAPPPQTVTAVETQTVDAQPTPATTEDVAAAFGGETRSEITQEIANVLYQHHEDIVNRNFRAAWALLTTRKQQQDLAKYGYTEWVRAQASLSPYLDPSGLQVRLLSLSPQTGEATVDVTGMTWTRQGARCTEWSGITWMLYEDGEWRYDPGYSTTPQRTRQWKSRYAELLGGSC
jgi:hypothetical protein